MMFIVVRPTITESYGASVDVDEDEKRELVILCAPQYGDGSYPFMMQMK
jgi:hypothetical protein